MVEICKIEGQPLLIKPEQRKRDIDVYAPFAASDSNYRNLKDLLIHNKATNINDSYSASATGRTVIKYQPCGKP